ncbi:aromatic ring-hydroxylating dioxygenase subunit alpha [Psychrobium sp. MM17-31]|uniref:aromatic ring-hydroxylating oxygenase subunit alpha n=1 Tax=Psychrobium sp. MM17-31 TaxID=2917758 RepID=UPI001EF4E03C|nr:aromatic ring-hydroxylating dioxygenase subunit alpha [Psychrobium sp. MM17-31]MCG7532791.1 aromatic ring-hydroxylating dioxygenase subunit alpha [Psychrobium sp. MM17-31]
MTENNLLPVTAYTQQQFFELELRHIFSETWAFAGFVEELQNDGDYLTVQAGLNNLVVIKNGEQLVAFHNRCKHRGTQLVEGKGNTRGKLTCPYHDWTYNTQGELKSLPKHKQEFAGLDKTCYNLTTANVGVWRGMIWVHPDINATPLSQWFAPINDHLGPHDVESLIESKDDIVVEEINANWKIVAENYIDHYHLAQLHAGTLSMYNHKKAEFGFEGPHFRFWEPLSDDYQKDLAKNSPMPLVYEASEENKGTWVPLLFPGIGLAESESSWSIFQIIPIAVNKTRVVVRTKVANKSGFEFMKQSALSASYWSNKVKAKSGSHDAKHALGSADFMQEDIYVCEQLQRAMQSPYFEMGPSALHGELPIRQHQKLVWNWVGEYYNAK